MLRSPTRITRATPRCARLRHSPSTFELFTHRPFRFSSGRSVRSSWLEQWLLNRYSLKTRRRSHFASPETKREISFQQMIQFSWIFVSFSIVRIVPFFLEFRVFEKVENHVEYYVMSVNVHAANERGNVQVERVKD